MIWEKPGKGPDGFTGLLSMWGGSYTRPPALSGMYLFDAYLDYAGCTYHHKDGAATCLFGPEGVPVEVAGSKLKIAKGAKPEKFSESGETWYEYGGANPNMVTLSFSARTGIFKGKYTLYYDYHDDKDRLQHKTVKVPYVGVMLADPETGKLLEGHGHCLCPDNDPAVKSYRLKRSYSVFIWDGVE